MRKDVGGWQVRLDDATIERYTASGDWLGRTVAELARELAERDPARVTHVFEGRPCRVADLLADADALAGALEARGFEAGEVVSFQLPNWREAVLIDLACAMLGLVVAPIVPIYRDAEVGYMLADSGARAVVLPDRVARLRLRRDDGAPRAGAAQAATPVRSTRRRARCQQLRGADRRGTPAAPEGARRSEFGQAAALHLRHHRPAQGRAAHPQHRPGDAAPCLPPLVAARGRRGADGLAGDAHHRLFLRHGTAAVLRHAHGVHGALERGRGARHHRARADQRQHGSDAVSARTAVRSRKDRASVAQLAHLRLRRCRGAAGPDSQDLRGTGPLPRLPRLWIERGPAGHPGFPRRRSDGPGRNHRRRNRALRSAGRRRRGPSAAGRTGGRDSRTRTGALCGLRQFAADRRILRRRELLRDRRPGPHHR